MGDEIKIRCLLKHFWYLIFLPVILVPAYFYVNHCANTKFQTAYYEVYIPNDSLAVLELENQLFPQLKTNWTFGLIDRRLDKKVKKGLYKISRGASNREIVNCLLSEQPAAIKVSIGNIRFRYNLIARLCKDLDIRSRSVRRELADETFIKELDTSFTVENVYSIFIQDSLWVYRNATAKDVVKSVHNKWKQYWTEERKALAKIKGLSPIEVMILASIVQSESQDKEELPTIAGLYLNRLNDEMKLQADPTVVYAWGKSLRRVLKKHLKIRSLYNTYRHKGLPPGPVFTSSREAIEAVLHAKEHDYLFFVANPGLDGKHDFSKTYKEHLEKAKSYRKKLNQKKIYK